jgi:outer membrane biosynthesis protein TonB
MIAELPSPRVTTAAVMSALLHGAFIAAALWRAAEAPPPVLPRVYRVNIVAAPAGPRAIGEVRPTSRVESPTAARPRPRPDVAPRAMPMPARPRAARPQPQSTPTTVQEEPQAAPAPTAGGGPIGGAGTDVATVQTAGIDFPFPGYLNNIVRQVALRFEPPDRDQRLKAEIMFLIHRDGSVTNLRFIKRSGSYPFDLEAQGAIEAAGTARAFGVLPEGFEEDVLPVSFSFDPQVLR